MTVVLLFLQLLTAVLCLLMRKPLAAVILLSAFSLISALLFYHLNAPDVALTEAAVGTGVTALIFVWIIHKTVGSEHNE
jgi:energy-converting hydrogenase B subunit D